MELRDYLAIVRSRKWVLALAVIVVTGAAIVASVTQPATYEGNAQVLIAETDTGAALFGAVLPELSSQPERSLQTQVELMQLRPVAEDTIVRLGLEMSPEALLNDVQVAAVGQTNVVEITAQASDPQLAADIANTMAEEYVTWSRESKRASIHDAAVEVDLRLEDAKDQILELGRRIEAQGKSDELEAELQIATGAYTTLSEKLEQLRINEELEVGSGSLVSPAYPNPDPVAPTPLRNAALGLAIGLLVGLGLAFLYEYMDDTLKTTEEAERAYGAPVLGTIPTEKLPKSDRSVAMLASPSSATAEAYRTLRNSLDFINFEQSMRTLLVTSAIPAEGKSTVASNLAASMAQAGRKVVLVSADFRRPTTDEYFGVKNLIGLSDVLLGEHSLKAALQRPLDDSLLVLTAGKMPPNPAELLGSEKMRDLLRELGDWADWTIIDTPPLLAVADPASVARWCDGVLLVTQATRSTRGAAHKAAELLAKVGARTVGVVVWGIPEGRESSYGYYAGGYHYYGSYYGAYSSSRGSVAASVPPGGGRLPDPTSSPGRRAARFIARTLVGALAFIAVLIVAALVAFFLDQYLDMGLFDALW